MKIFSYIAAVAVAVLLLFAPVQCDDPTTAAPASTAADDAAASTAKA